MKFELDLSKTVFHDLGLLISERRRTEAAAAAAATPSAPTAPATTDQEKEKEKEKEQEHPTVTATAAATSEQKIEEAPPLKKKKKIPAVVSLLGSKDERGDFGRLHANRLFEVTARAERRAQLGNDPTDHCGYESDSFIDDGNDGAQESGSESPKKKKKRHEHEHGRHKHKHRHSHSHEHKHKKKVVEVSSGSEGAAGDEAEEDGGDGGEPAAKRRAEGEETPEVDVPIPEALRPIVTEIRTAWKRDDKLGEQKHVRALAKAIIELKSPEENSVIRAAAEVLSRINKTLKKSSLVRVRKIISLMRKEADSAAQSSQPSAPMPVKSELIAPAVSSTTPPVPATSRTRITPIVIATIPPAPPPASEPEREELK